MRAGSLGFETSTVQPSATTHPQAVQPIVQRRFSMMQCVLMFMLIMVGVGLGFGMGFGSGYLVFHDDDDSSMINLTGLDMNVTE